MSHHGQEEDDQGKDIEDPDGQVYPCRDKVQLLPLPSLCLSYSWKISMATLSTDGSNKRYTWDTAVMPLSEAVDGHIGDRQHEEERKEKRGHSQEK